MNGIFELDFEIECIHFVWLDLAKYTNKFWHLRPFPLLFCKIIYCCVSWLISFFSSLVAARFLHQSIAPSSVQRILFDLFNLIINELSQSEMILWIDTVFSYESGGDWGWIRIDVRSCLLLGASDVDADLECLVGFVISVVAEAAWGPLAWWHWAQSFASLIKWWLREHLLPWSLPIRLRSLERRVDGSLRPIV